MGIFDERVAFKPFEYPKAIEFVDALQASFWTHKEFSFTQDIQDFKTKLNDHEREIVRRCLLSISQIEISVKSFWGKLYDHFPKPELNSLGIQLAFNELVHERAYSELLEVLGLNGDFEKVLEVPEIQGRVNYLRKYIKGSTSNKEARYTLNLALFSAFVENCSLFSQFFLIKSFNKFKHSFSGIDNVISSTILEEQIHHNVGAWLIGLIREEYPEWFDKEFEASMIRACKKAYEAEVKIVEWIMQGKDTEFISREDVLEFLKRRFNQSMVAMGFEPLYPEDESKDSKIDWFELELKVDRHTDFFAKRPSTYSRDLAPVTEDNLF